MELVKRVAGFLLLCSAFFNILPENSVKNYVKKVAGFMLIIIILSGVRDKLRLDISNFEFDILGDETKLEQDYYEKMIKKTLEINLKNCGVKCKDIKLDIVGEQIKKIVIKADDAKEQCANIKRIVGSLILIDIENIEVVE